MTISLSLTKKNEPEVQEATSELELEEPVAIVEGPALEPANDVVFSLGAQGAGTFQKTSK